MGNGDGWVQCAAGHRHWGRFGAAGLLLVDAAQVVLQHRSRHTHEGGTWALPGGARDSHEDPVQTALREADEEAGIEAAAVEPLGLSCVDHDGWTYTTVIARALRTVHPYAANWESDDVRWWPVPEVATLPLHAGFAAAWPALRAPGLPVHVVVDAANVVGSRPDGWWRDRPGANARLRERLLRLSRAGLSRDELPAGVATPPFVRVLPLITLVVEGAARAIADVGAGYGADRTDWWQRSVTTIAAASSGDDAIVDATAALASGETGGASIVVVTADRGLRDRLLDSVVTTGPSWLWERLDAIAEPPRR